MTKRETERQTDRQTDRQRQRDRQTDRDREKETERDPLSDHRVRSMVRHGCTTMARCPMHNVFCPSGKQYGQATVD